MIKALIFDFDGVLVLSDTPRFQTIQKVAKNNQITITNDEIKKMRGITTVNFLNKILAKSEKSRIANIITEYENVYKKNINDYIKPIPTTVSFIKSYTGQLPFALATMSSRNVIETVTKQLGIFNKFKSITCKEDVAQPKPHPEIYIQSAQKLGLQPEECAVIEDTMTGVHSAIEAQMQCYVLLNGSNKKEDFSRVAIQGFITSQEDLEKIS